MRKRHGCTMLAVLVLTAGLDARASTTGGPRVVSNGKAPTGHAVTFSIDAPQARSMRIRGAWLFASTRSTSTDIHNLHPIRAADWHAGDFPLQSPNTPSENWPVEEMKRDPRSGLWTLTMPLPGGTFDYQFFADCPAPRGSVAGCTPITDPARPAWNAHENGASPASFSQVFVPRDPRYDPADVALQADAPAGQRGALREILYDTPHDPAGRHALAVYLPARYDPHRAKPYPVLVLSHGGGENETAWSTRGRMQQIADNLIAQGRIEPVVIVMPNGSGVTDGSYADEIEHHILPLIEQRFHVVRDAAGRAFAGTSAYGGQANVLLFEHTGLFGYYGVWSPAFGAPALEDAGSRKRGAPAPSAEAYRAGALRQVRGIHLAIGLQDMGGNAPMATAMTERVGLANAGVPVTEFIAPGGHTWAFWREALADFLIRTAFRPPVGTPLGLLGSRGPITRHSKPVR